jgi:hypothetical protein
MAPELRQQLGHLYHGACECGRDVLDAVDPGMRRGVELPLAQDASGDSMLDRAAVTLHEAATLSAQRGVNSQLGP